jgi:hypothetical protein
MWKPRQKRGRADAGPNARSILLVLPRRLFLQALPPSSFSTQLVNFSSPRTKSPQKAAISVIATPNLTRLTVKIIVIFILFSP